MTTKNRTKDKQQSERRKEKFEGEIEVNEVQRLNNDRRKKREVGAAWAAVLVR